MKTKASILSDKYGGKWVYNGGFSGRWESGDRVVQRTCCGSYDLNGEPICDTCFGPKYWLYEDNKQPKQVDFGYIGIKSLFRLTL